YVYFQLSVINKDLVSNFYILMKIWIRDIDPFFGTYKFFIGECENITWHNIDTTVFHFSDAKLGALEVTENGNIVRFFYIDLADIFNDLFFILMRTMGKIQSEYINSASNKVQ